MQFLDANSDVRAIEMRMQAVEAALSAMGDSVGGVALTDRVPSVVEMTHPPSVDTTWPGFEVVDVAGYDNLVVDVFHLGKLVTLTEAIGEDTHYWVEVDQAAAGTGETSAEKVESVMEIASGSAFPTSSAKLVYPLIAIDADDGTAYRYCWMLSTGSDTADLRFATVTTPDVPIGTVWIWDIEYPAATIPLGWAIKSYGANPYLAAYASAQEDYDTPGETLGSAVHGGGTNDHKDHDLSHHHTPLLAGGETGTYLEPGDTPYEDTGVKEWTGTDTETAAKPVTGNLAEHSETDNRPPTTVVVYIKRTALA